MIFVYFNKDTATTIEINIGVLPYRELDYTLKRASQKFFDDLYYDPINDAVVDYLFEHKIIEITSLQPNENLEWLKEHLFAKWIKKKYYVDNQTNDLLERYAEGVTASLYFDVDKGLERIHYIPHSTAAKRLIELDDSVVYKHNSNYPTEIIFNIDEAEIL